MGPSLTTEPSVAPLSDLPSRDTSRYPLSSLPRDPPKPFLSLIAEDLLIHAFLDTGPDVSIISDEFRMKIPSLRKKPLNKQFLHTQSVTGQKMDTLGTIPITVKVGSFTTSHTFQVVRGINRQFLLGWDFFSTHSAKIDVANATFTLANQTCPLVTFPRDSPISCNVRISSLVTLPAMSESNISVVLDSPIQGYTPDAYIGVFEPDYCPRDSPLAMARTLSQVDVGHTTVRIMNPTNQEVKLFPDTRIGQFYSVSDDSQSEYSVTEPSPSVNEVTVPTKSPLPPVDISKTSISPSQLREVETLLCKHSAVFSTGPNDFGRTNLVTHRIRTGDASPVRQRAYRTSPKIKSEIRSQVDTLLDHDVIEESHSPWSSPVVMVKKKDGSYRFCVDYRKLNKLTVKDSHPLPRTDDSLDALSGSVFFSTIDLSSGYWQVAVHPDDREKTAFTTGDGLYQFKVMPMGLTNAPPTFQRLMELVLSGLHWSSCLVYLDDVIIVGKSFAEHMSNLEQVLLRFKQANLKLKPSKCHFLHTEVRFLGHVVSNKGIRPDPTNTERVAKWPTPTNPTDVRSFLGLCSYYRRFIKGFAAIAVPLHRLTQKNVPFEWSADCEDAFCTLRDALIQPPIMAYPDASHPFTIFTDASHSAIGCVLSQIQDGTERVVAYASHVLTAAEQRWSTYDRELWAIVWSIRHFRHYLVSAPFTIVTDHKPLVGLRKLPVQNDRTGRRSRWALELDPYDWVITHRDGKRHSNADALSRCPQIAPSSPPTLSPVATQQASCSSVQTPPNTLVPQSSSDVSQPHSPNPDSSRSQRTKLLANTPVKLENDIRQEQLADPVLSEVITWVQTRTRPRRSLLRRALPATRRLWRDFRNLVFVDDILCRKFRPSPGQPHIHQVIIPKSLQSSVLSQLHGDPFSGHFSADKTFQRSANVCYWPYIRRDIDIFCTTCHSCESRRNPTPRNKAPMQIDNSSRPFQRIFADITELPITSKQNRYVLVVMDQFTKYVNMYPLRDQTAHSVARCIFDHYICEHGVPETLHTDQGRQFDGALVHELCKLLGINKTRTSPYHPQSDGLVERFNRSMKDQLAKYLATTPGEWDDVLHQVAFAYNSTVHSSTGFTPFYLATGREPRLPAIAKIGTPISPTYQTPDAYAVSLQTRMQSAFQHAASTQQLSSDAQKSAYDAKIKFKPYKPGDLVWLDDPAKARTKLAPRWKGPYKVLASPSCENQNPVTYSILDLQNPDAKPKRIHYNRLKPYRSSILPQRLPPPLLPTPPSPITALSGSIPLPTPSFPAPLLNPPLTTPLHPSSSSMPTHLPPPDPPLNLRPTPPYNFQQSQNSPPVRRTRSGRLVTRPSRLGFPSSSY